MSVNEIFERAREDLYYPPLDFEVRDVQRSYIDFSSREFKIVLSYNQIRALSKRSLLGLLHHELNHWVKHPYDLKTLILESYWLRDWKDYSKIRNAFDDIVVNLDLIEKDLRDVVNVYRELKPNSALENIVRAVLSELTGLDFGEYELSEEMESKIDDLLKIDYLDTRKSVLKQNIVRFAEIVGEKDYKTIFINFDFRDFPDSKIFRAMKEISQDFEREEFRSVFRFVGIDRSESTFEEDADIVWYLARATNYLKFTRSKGSGSLYPNEIKDFCLEDSLDLYNPIESYMKFIPGIAKKFSLKDFEGFSRSKEDLVIVIDSSGSMSDPKREKSLAVLMAFAIAKKRIEEGGRVGVVNFSGRTVTLHPTRSYDVFKYIKAYQGGGTYLDLKVLKDFMKNVRGKYVMITDGGIDNFDEVKDFLSRFDLIVWISRDVKGREEFERIKSLENVFEVRREEDIVEVLKNV